MAKNLQGFVDLVGADLGELAPSGTNRVSKIARPSSAAVSAPVSESRNPGTPTLRRPPVVLVLSETPRGQIVGGLAKSSWTRCLQVLLTPETEQILVDMAQRLSTPECRVTAMQLASQLLEEAVAKRA